MRKNIPILENYIVPSLMKMLASFDLDLEEWANTVEEEEVTKSDVHTLAKIATDRFSKSIGEKVTI